MRAATFLLAALWLPLTVSGQERPAKAEKQAQRQAAKAEAQEVNQAVRAARQAANMPPILRRLWQMSPEERAAALARLPAAQRQRIERQLENFSKQPPEQQARTLNQQQRLTALPPEQRMHARESLRQLGDIPPPRRRVILMELQRLGAMTDEQRSEYVANRVFRSRFSEAEIQMMNDLRGIVP